MVHSRKYRRHKHYEIKSGVTWVMKDDGKEMGKEELSSEKTTCTPVATPLPEKEWESIEQMHHIIHSPVQCIKRSTRTYKVTQPTLQHIKRSITCTADDDSPLATFMVNTGPLDTFNHMLRSKTAPFTSYLETIQTTQQSPKMYADSKMTDPSPTTPPGTGKRKIETPKERRACRRRKIADLLKNGLKKRSEHQAKARRSRLNDRVARHLLECCVNLSQLSLSES